MSSSDKLRISLEEIVLATNDFAEETIIGKGGFGTVYQGQSRQHGLLAIKRLNPLFGQGVHEYGMEVTLLSKYKHENLVSLIGFCRENGEKILVYKYEANLSLDKVLHRKELSWMRRLHICLGAARGLMYLHNETGSEHGVIHRDIKSPNILLDENWNAKISDFGLSKIALTNSADSVVFTRACGTNGYVDPQLLLGYGVTQKSDVYSFGVVLYEVLFGKLVGQPRDHRFTVKMAKSYYKENILHKMIVSGLKYEMNSDSLSTFSTIAFQCLKKRREDRPTMSMVVEALEKALDYQQASSRGLYGGNLKIRLQEILSATNGFDEANIIGIGGYGIMYLGDSEEHGMLAIKRLKDVYSRQGDNEYEMEVTLLSKYKHENLVRLVGFCGEDGEQILVYKYEANQSLDKFLHSKDLSWIRRLQICLGAAQGLSYLHNEAGSEQGVIHSDIKSSNILLDENWNAKLSDYGLSKIQPHVDVTCGTPGYVDPQIYQDGDITQKSDVYSFGVVLYEVLFGKLVLIPGYLHDGRFTVKMAKMHYEEKTLHMIIDPDLGNEINFDSLSTFSTIAYQCLKKRKEYRPTMSSVVEALEKALGYQQAAPLTRVSA